MRPISITEYTETKTEKLIQLLGFCWRGVVVVVCWKMADKDICFTLNLRHNLSSHPGATDLLMKLRLAERW